MKNAIILHGLPSKSEYYSPDYPSASNSHWIPWLQKQLMMHDIKADTPEIFNVYEPNYENFVKEIERFEINENTLLVGHSMGAGFWLRYLSEHSELKVSKVVLVAPWLNIDREYDINFFDFELDTTIPERVKKLTIFSSEDDDRSISDTVDYIKKNISNVEDVTFKDRGHFTRSSMGTDAFPELLNTVLTT